MPRFTAGLLALLAVALTGGMSAQLSTDGIPKETLSLLKGHLAFTEGNVAALSRGQVVRKTLDTHDPSEVVAVGAVKIAVPRRFFIHRSATLSPSSEVRTCWPSAPSAPGRRSAISRT